MDFLCDDEDEGAISQISKPISTASFNVDESACNAIPFKDVCIMFNQVEKEHGAENKVNRIFNQSLSERVGKSSIYPLMRLVLPSCDSERGKYGLKQTSLARLYIKALNLDSKSEDAEYLLKWEKPMKGRGTGQNDFGIKLEEVLSARANSAASNVTVGDINKLLDSIAHANNATERDAILQHQVVTKFNATEQKWLMRIIFQDLKIGLSQATLLTRISEEAEERYNECGNLRLVCEELVNGKLKRCGLQLFEMYSPMLAEKGNKTYKGQIRFAETKMSGHPFVMDLKLDGERMSCHTDGRRVMLATRSSVDYTSKYSGLANDMMAALKGYSAIVDGEVMAFDTKKGESMVFGSNRTVGNIERDGKAGSTVLVYYAFDMLYLAGSNALTVINKCIDEYNSSFLPKFTTAADRADYTVARLTEDGEIAKLPLQIRRDILKDVLRLQENRIELVTCSVVDKLKPADRIVALEEFYNKIFSDGEEGLVVKDLTSPYCLGLKSRSIGHWVKLKPDYGDECQLLDLAVVGAYYGNGVGYRGRGLSVLLCAVKDEEDKFVPFCKVGTGFSYAALKSLRENLQGCSEHPIPRPDHIRAFPSGQDKKENVVYIPFEKMFVVEMKSYELVDTFVFPTGITARFPRAHRLREDKGPYDIATLAEIKELRNNGMRGGVDGTALAKRKATPDKPLKEKRMASENLVFHVPKKTAQSESHLFEDLRFCVKDFVNGAEDGLGVDGAISRFDRKSVINLIEAHGGEVHANPSHPCFVISGSKRSVDVKALAATGEFDILHFSFVVDCVVAECVLEPKERHFVAKSKVRQAALGDTLDPYGDSYVEDLDEADLRALLRKMPQPPATSDWRDEYNASDDTEFRQMLEELNPLWSPSIVIYVDIFKDVGLIETGDGTKKRLTSERDPESLLVLDLELLKCYGGNVSEHLTAAVTHIVIHPLQLGRRGSICNRIRQLRCGHDYSPEKRIVTAQWITDCIENRSDESRFAFHPSSPHDASALMWIP